MHDRRALGSADVSDSQLTGMVAALFDADPGATVLLDSAASEFPYDLTPLTTAGRYWVSGTAEVSGTPRSFRLFVKHIQSWSRHPFFEMVPLEHREVAAAMVPWRTEALAYSFDLSQLIVGDVQVGRRGSEDLAEVEEAALDGYLAGLRDEGSRVPDDVVRRAHPRAAPGRPAARRHRTVQPRPAGRHRLTRRPAALHRQVSSRPG
jgi:hypothetical protein